MRTEKEYYEYIGKILENIHPSVTITDGTGKFVYIGKGSHEFFGERVEKLLGMSTGNPQVAEIFHPCVSEMVLEKKKKIVTTQKNKEGEEAFVTGIPIFDRAGKIQTVICFSSWEITSYDDLRMHYEQLKQENQSLLKEISRLTREDYIANNVIGKSRNVENAVRILKIFSGQNLPSFVYGPAGSGKNYLIRIAYEQEGAVYEYNCNLISAETMEHDLFGAGEERGLLESLSYHTVIIHNVECLSPALQKKLIDVIKWNRLSVVGTSIRSLEELRSENKIIEEFYYFFKSYQVQILSINERPEDLQEFLEYYISLFNAKYGRKVIFTPKALNCLLRYEWKENISEIRYTIERLILTAEKERIDIYNLPGEITRQSEELFLENSSLKDMMEIYEKGIICRAYQKYHTTVEVAKHLGISQASAVRKIGKYVEDRKKNQEEGI